jgi:hypothetical protein
MRIVALTLFAIVSASGFAKAAPLSPANMEIDVCMRAAAASDHVALKEVDKGACTCATNKLHAYLKPTDFDLHEQMLEAIASGADEKTFNAQMSDIMQKRGMNQSDVDKFLARSKAAELKAQDACNPSLLLGPDPGKTPAH